MIDTGLLNKALEAIELEPERHVQSEWHCETGQCLAGFIGEVSGAKWKGEDEYGDLTAFIVNPDYGVENYGFEPRDRTVHVADYAEHILGGSQIRNLTREEFDRLWPNGTRNHRGVPMTYDQELAHRAGYASLHGRDVYFDLFSGDNTREQLRVALSIIEERQAPNVEA